MDLNQNMSPKAWNNVIVILGYISKIDLIWQYT